MSFVDSLHDMEYSLLNVRGNRSEAEFICSKDISNLPFSDPDGNYSQVKDYIKTYNVKKSWIGVKKKMYGTPHWINSSVVGLYERDF